MLPFSPRYTLLPLFCGSLPLVSSGAVTCALGLPDQCGCQHTFVPPVQKQPWRQTVSFTRSSGRGFLRLTYVLCRAHERPSHYVPATCVLSCFSRLRLTVRVAILCFKTANCGTCFALFSNLVHALNRPNSSANPSFLTGAAKQRTAVSAPL